MLTLIDNHLVPFPYWSAIDGYIIAEARKGLPGNALKTHVYYCAVCSFCRVEEKKKPNAFYSLDTTGIPAMNSFH